MMNKLFLTLFALPFLCSAAPPENIPTEIKEFIAKRGECDHLRGELPDPSEKERLEDAIKEINKACKGTDAKLSALKRQYSGNAVVMRRLKRSEPLIEASGS